jgi:hypothetical protein
MKLKLIKLVLSFIGVIFILSIIISYESTVVPEWKVKVVDNNNNPIEWVEVYQTWSQKSLELSSDNREMLVSNANGEVIFPERTIKASLLRRGLGLIADIIASFNPHATTGKFAIVYTQKDPTAILMYRDGWEFEHVLIIKE